MKKFLLSLAVSAAIATGAQAATINVGTEATFAPFEFMDEQTKELTGFVMEIIEAVAKDMGDIMIRKDDTGKYKDFTSLEGTRLCAQIGTTGAMMAKRVKNAKVTEFNSITEAFMELKAKGCEAVINDKPVVDYYLVRRGDKAVTTVPQVFDAEHYGMAVKQGNKALVEKLNEGLKRIRANGVYDKIYAKWFGAH